MKLNVNGTNISYEIHGKAGAPWLVLSHSLACSVRMWDEQIEAFKGTHRVLAFDTRGHGASDAPKGAYTLEMLADDAKAVLDHEGITRCHWAGLSMGGMIGQVFALKYPGVLQTLTLADTTSRYPAEAAGVWTDRIKLAEEKGMEPLVEPTLQRWFTEPYRQKKPQRLADIANLIRTTPVAGYAGCCQAIPKINVTARLKEIRCPILVIVGEQDMGTPPSMAKEIHDNAPGSTLVVIPNAAHIANVEQPAAFTAAMQKVLSA